VTLSVLKTAKLIYLRYLSKPPGNRIIYRAIRRAGATKIVEIGVGTGLRAVRMIEVAACRLPVGEVQYTGMDPFEARSTADGPGMTLKAAYRLLRATGAKIQLVPGDPLASLARAANSLGKIDLLVVSAGLEGSCPRAWWFVPRLLHERTAVYVEEPSAEGQPRLRLMPKAEIDRLAAAGAVRRAA
jgi:hypothetical protein